MQLLHLLLEALHLFLVVLHILHDAVCHVLDWITNYSQGGDYLVLEMLFGHSGDVPQLLQDLVEPGQVLVLLHFALDREDLVDYLSWDETAEFRFYIVVKHIAELKDLMAQVNQGAVVRVQFVVRLLRQSLGQLRFQLLNIFCIKENMS